MLAMLSDYHVSPVRSWNLMQIVFLIYLICHNVKHALCFASFFSYFVSIGFYCLFDRRGEGQLQAASWMTKDERC